MHVVLTCNFSPWSRYSGGGQRSTHMLASALRAHGAQVTVIYTKPPWERIVVPRVPYRVAFAALPALRSRRDAWFRPLSALAVRRSVATLSIAQPVDVVHAQGEEAALLPEARPYPLVLTPRYPRYPARLLEARNSLTARAALWLTHAKYGALAATARRADLVCATSAFSAGAVTDALGVPNTRLRVVPNGIDPAFFEVTRPARAAAGPLVFFGRLERDKGLDVLLDALERGHGRRAVQIVGEGSMAGEIRRKLAQSGLAGRVTLHPWESSAALSRRLAEAALAVLPSRTESFGNAVAEALAAGTPLLTTWAGSLPELVAHAQSGWLVPPGDAAALGRALDTLLDDPHSTEALGRAGREAMRARCGWDAVARSCLALYEEARQLHAESAP